MTIRKSWEDNRIIHYPICIFPQRIVYSHSILQLFRNLLIKFRAACWNNLSRLRVPATLQLAFAGDVGGRKGSTCMRAG